MLYLNFAFFRLWWHLYNPVENEFVDLWFLLIPSAECFATTPSVWYGTWSISYLFCLCLHRLTKARSFKSFLQFRKRANNEIMYVYVNGIRQQIKRMMRMHFIKITDVLNWSWWPKFYDTCVSESHLLSFFVRSFWLHCLIFIVSYIGQSKIAIHERWKIPWISECFSLITFIVYRFVFMFCLCAVCGDDDSIRRADRSRPSKSASKAVEMSDKSDFDKLISWHSQLSVHALFQNFDRYLELQMENMELFK